MSGMRGTPGLAAFLSTGLFLGGCGGEVRTGTTVGDRGTLQHLTFQELDRDENGSLDPEEFFGAAGVYYAELDANEDGRLIEHELSDGFHRIWDRDADGRVQPCELARASATWLTAGPAASFERWDEDANGWVDRAEFRRGMARAELFEQLDENRDGLLTDLEFSDGLWRQWDQDGNGALEPDEWRWGDGSPGDRSVSRPTSSSD